MNNAKSAVAAIRGHAPSAMPHPTRKLSGSRLLRAARAFGLAVGGLLTFVPPGAAEEPVAVFSTVFNGYVRTRLPDQSYKPEFYVFGEGGCVTRNIKDPAMEQMNFLKVAQDIAPTLAHLNYRPALKSADAELLILVFWGSTQGSSGADPTNAKDRLSTAAAAVNNASNDKSASISGAAEATPDAAAQAALDSALWQMGLANDERDKLDNRNARILGYSDSLSRARFVSHMSMGQDVIQEIADNRYYVVLQAYDFATARKFKKLKPLWTVRLSMREGGDFSQALDVMLARGAPYFGKDSNGLKRYVVPEGHVKFGPTEVLPDKDK